MHPSLPEAKSFSTLPPMAAAPLPEGAILPSRLQHLSPHYLPAKLRSILLALLAFACFVLLLLVAFQPVAIESKIGALIVFITTLLPAWLWILGKAPGLPLFPAVSAAFVLSYGTPLITGSEKFLQYTSFDNSVMSYSGGDHLSAAVKFGAFQIVATVVWLFILHQPIRIPRSYRILPSSVSNILFLVVLLLNSLFWWYTNGRWFEVPYSLYSIFRAASLGLGVIAAALLFYRVGKREVPLPVRIFAVFLVIAAGLSANMSLYLNGGIGLLCVALTAFIAGRGKIPLIASGALVALALVLHHGKGEMRYRYWHLPARDGREVPAFQPMEYPALYQEWIRYGIYDLRYSNRSERENNLASWKLLDRFGVVDNFLLVQAKVSKDLPLLKGKTYRSVVPALVPRFLNPEKAAPHDGQYLLNRHYAVIPEDQIGKTFIEWGLLAEAYANFGVWGMLGYALFSATALAYCTRISLFTPILSYRSLVAGFTTVMLVGGGGTAGIFATTWFQGMIVLVPIAFTFMVKREMPQIRRSL